jgi:hypothetical protein
VKRVLIFNSREQKMRSRHLFRRVSPHILTFSHRQNIAAMKMNTKLIGSIIGITALAFTGSITAAYAGGTDVLHLTLQKTMTNEGLETNAAGTVILNQNAQGKANKQSLTAQATGLTPTNNYSLLAQLADLSIVDAADFTTDEAGNATLAYGGKTGNPLPAPLDPLRNVRAFAIATIVTNLLSVDTNIVLSADLSSSESFKYLVKRTVSTNGVTAKISLKASETKAQFKIAVTGLAPDTDYLFAVNDEVADNFTSDSKGRASKSASSQDGNLDPAEILSVHSIGVWDSFSNVVFRATLP